MKGDSHQIWQALTVIGVILICSFQSKGIEVCPENGILHFNCTHTSSTGIFFEKTNCTRATMNQSGCNGLFSDMQGCFLQEECNISTAGHICVHYKCEPKLEDSATTLENAQYSSEGIFWLHHLRSSNESQDEIECSLQVNETIYNFTAALMIFYLAPFAKKNNTCLITKTPSTNYSVCTGSGEISQNKMFEVTEDSLNMSFSDRGTHNLDFHVLIYVYVQSKPGYLYSHLICTSSGSKHRPPTTDPRSDENSSPAISQGTTRETMHHAMSTTTERPLDGEISVETISTMPQTTTCTDRTPNDATRRQNFLVPFGISVAALFLIASIVVLMLIVRMAMKTIKTQPAPLNKNIYCTPGKCDTTVHQHGQQRGASEGHAIREMYSQPERRPKTYTHSKA